MVTIDDGYICILSVRRNLTRSRGVSQQLGYLLLDIGDAKISVYSAGLDKVRCYYNDVT